MHYSISQLEKLTQLHRDYHEAARQISEIKKMIYQLLEHECTANFSFSYHDHVQCAENKSRRGLEPLMPGYADGWFLGMPVSYPDPAASNHIPCQKSLVFDCTEATGIRILNALLKEKQELQELTLQEWQKLATELAAVPPTSDAPTFFLHNK